MLLTMTGARLLLAGTRLRPASPGPATLGAAAAASPGRSSASAAAMPGSPGRSRPGLLLLTTPAAIFLLLLIVIFAVSTRRRPPGAARARSTCSRWIVVAVLALPYAVWLMRAETLVTLPAAPQLSDLQWP